MQLITLDLHYAKKVKILLIFAFFLQTWQRHELSYLVLWTICYCHYSHVLFYYTSFLHSYNTSNMWKIHILQIHYFLLFFFLLHDLSTSVPGVTTMCIYDSLHVVRQRFIQLIDLLSHLLTPHILKHHLHIRPKILLVARYGQLSYSFLQVVPHVLYDIQVRGMSWPFENRRLWSWKNSDTWWAVTEAPSYWKMHGCWPKYCWVIGSK